MSLSISKKAPAVSPSATPASSVAGTGPQASRSKPSPHAQIPSARKQEGVKDTFDKAPVKQPLVALLQEAKSSSVSAVMMSPAALDTPPPPPPRQTPTAEQAAQKEVALETVATSQKDIEEARGKLHEATHGQVNDLFDMAAGKSPIPKNSEVKQLSDNQAELVRRNEAGDVIERTMATRQPDGSVLVDSATFEGGKNVRDRIEANADGSTYAQHAEWPGQNEAEGLKNFGDIDRAKDPNLVYTSQRVSHSEEGNLQIEKYAQAGGAVSGSRTSYHQESLNIDDKLEGDFDRSKPVDTEETYSYSIPAPGPDGSQPNPQYQRTERFSQDQGKEGPIQATAYTSRELDGHKQYAGEGPHNRLELDAVREAYAHGGDGKGEQYDADDARDTGQQPKQWLLEKKKSDNSLDSQTFVEGQIANSIVTHTEVNGDTVKHRYTGKTLKPDGEGYGHVEGASTTKYAPDGSIEHTNSARLEADGTKAIDVYDSQREVTDQGLKLGERASSTRIAPDGKTTKGEHLTESLISGDGVQLLGSRNTLTGPDGSSARTVLDSKGPRLFVAPPGEKAREVRAPEDIPDEALRELAANSVVETNQEIAAYASSGGANAFKSVQGVSTPNDKGQFLSDRLSHLAGTETVAKVSQGLKGGATAVGGVAGVTAGIAGIIDGVKDGNKVAIAKGVFDTLGGAVNLYETGEAFKGIFKNTSDLAGAGRWVGGAAQATGVAPTTSGATSVASKIGGALKGLGGASNVLGAAVGIASGTLDIIEGLKTGRGGQVAKGAVGIAGTVGGVVASIVVGSAFGGPAGIAVGALVGGLVLAAQKFVEVISDDDHQIHFQEI
ncbi:hypothetical protein [Stigmatella aurantiaca]|nr:hypothetical protein [Stigmatella aurantiaca]ADO70896.1 conserved uncharacterized protein [Stigmatella aurantiaca DW4/3-1]